MALKSTESVVKTEVAKSDLGRVMKHYSNFGATDSEGEYAVRLVEDAADEGKKFPLYGSNPFSIYSSMAGWKVVSVKLVAAAYEYWLCMIEERLGIEIVRERSKATK